MKITELIEIWSAMGKNRALTTTMEALKELAVKQKNLNIIWNIHKKIFREEPKKAEMRKTKAWKRGRLAQLEKLEDVEVVEQRSIERLKEDVKKLKRIGAPSGEYMRVTKKIIDYYTKKLQKAQEKIDMLSKKRSIYDEDKHRPRKRRRTVRPVKRKIEPEKKPEIPAVKFYPSLRFRPTGEAPISKEPKQKDDFIGRWLKSLVVG